MSSQKIAFPLYFYSHVSKCLYPSNLSVRHQEAPGNRFGAASSTRAALIQSETGSGHHICLVDIRPVTTKLYEPTLLGSCDRLCDFYFLRVHLLLLCLQWSVHISASLNFINMAGGHFDVMEDIWKTITDSLKQIYKKWFALTFHWYFWHIPKHKNTVWNMWWIAVRFFF